MNTHQTGERWAFVSGHGSFINHYIVESLHNGQMAKIIYLYPDDNTHYLNEIIYSPYWYGCMGTWQHLVGQQAPEEDI